MKETNKARLLLITSSILWGTSFPVIRYGLEYITPLYFVFMRFFIAFIVTLSLLAVAKKLNIFIHLLKNKFIAATGVLNAVAFIFQFIGQKYTFATNASLLVNTSPIFTAIVAHFYLSERINLKRLISILIAITGVYYLITGGTLMIYFSSRIIGDALCLLSGFMWGLYIAMSKKLTSSESDDLSIYAVWFLYVAAISFPFLIYFNEVSTLNSGAVFAILYTSIFNTVIPFAMWYAALKKLGATTSSIYFMIEILVSAIIEDLLIENIASPSLIIGGIMIIVGIYLTDKFYKEN